MIRSKTRHILQTYRCMIVFVQGWCLQVIIPLRSPRVLSKPWSLQFKNSVSPYSISASYGRWLKKDVSVFFSKFWHVVALMSLFLESSNLEWIVERLGNQSEKKYYSWEECVNLREVKVLYLLHCKCYQSFFLYVYWSSFFLTSLLVGWIIQTLWSWRKLSARMITCTLCLSTWYTS